MICNVASVIKFTMNELLFELIVIIIITVVVVAVLNHKCEAMPSKFITK